MPQSDPTGMLSYYQYVYVFETLFKLTICNFFGVFVINLKKLHVFTFAFVTNIAGAMGDAGIKGLQGLLGLTGYKGKKGRSGTKDAL